MKALSYRLINLHKQYLVELGRFLDYSAAYGRKSPAAIMQASAVKDVLHAYFVELDKHVDQEPDIYKRPPKETA